MGEEQNVLHSPQAGQTLAEYLQSFTDTEVQEIHSNPELLIRFSGILQESFRAFERAEDGLENLWHIIERLDDFDQLLYYIRQLEPERLKLLGMLVKKEKELKQTSKLCAVGRLVGSSVDILGTVGGLWMRSFNSGYANLTFRAATAFGLLGLVSTTSEMNILKSTSDDLMRLIRRDQELFAPIQRWYQQTHELEEAMRAVFPFDLTSHIVADFADIANTEFNPARLLAALLRSIGEQDIRRLRDEVLIRNLINFTLYPASQDWFQWIIFRRHPVILDITRIVLQLQHSPLRFTLCQSIPALALADQNIESFPVWGRIGLNLISIVDAIRSLNSSEISVVASEMSHLRRHLASEIVSLQRIREFVQLRRNQNS